MRIKIILFIGLCIGVISSASENGVAEDQNKDRTGTPDGSNTCSQCHNAGAFNPFMNLVVNDLEGNPMAGYIPGDTLRLRFTVNSIGGLSPTAFGFQATVLDALLADAGEFINPGNNVQIEEVNNTQIPSRQVVEHANAAPVGIFIVDWIAPEDVGDLTFYYSGLAANGNGGSGGDNAVTGTMTLPLAEPDGLEDIALSGIDLRYSADWIWIESDEHQALDALTLFDLSGRQLRRKTQITLPHSLQLPRGVSLLLLEKDGKALTEKIWN